MVAGQGRGTGGGGGDRQASDVAVRRRLETAQRLATIVARQQFNSATVDCPQWAEKHLGQWIADGVFDFKAVKCRIRFRRRLTDQVIVHGGYGEKRFQPFPRDVMDVMEASFD